MSRAEKMFADLGYFPVKDNEYELQFADVQRNNLFRFFKKVRALKVQRNYMDYTLTAGELRAVCEKVKELSWSDDAS